MDAASLRPALFNADDVTCNNSFARYNYDLEKAKALLEEAGQEKFAFDFWYSNGLAYNNDIAILIKNSLGRIGVTVNLKPTPQVQLMTAVRANINRENDSMTGMYLHEATFWLADPVTLTNSGMVSTTQAGGANNWSRQSIKEIDESALQISQLDRYGGAHGGLPQDPGHSGGRGRQSGSADHHGTHCRHEPADQRGQLLAGAVLPLRTDPSQVNRGRARALP